VEQSRYFSALIVDPANNGEASRYAIIDMKDPFLGPAVIAQAGGPDSAATIVDALTALYDVD